jgi:hypothetical protein
MLLCSFYFFVLNETKLLCVFFHVWLTTIGTSVFIYTRGSVEM